MTETNETVMDEEKVKRARKELGELEVIDASINMAFAQLEREGFFVSRIGPDGIRRWKHSTEGNDAERATAMRAQQAWKAQGCPVYDEGDLPLFANGAEAI